MLKRDLLWIAGTLLLSGCAEKPRPAEVTVTMAPALKSNAESNAESNATLKPSSKPNRETTEAYEASVGGFKFQVPGDWEEKPPKSDVLLGEFSIPGDAGPARLTLSSARGGIEANLDRWRGQFQAGPNDPPPRQSEIQFDGKDAVLIELNGTYSDMFGGGKPTRNSSMLGVGASLGETEFFVKMTGPAETVAARRDEFLKFVESAHRQR